MKLNKIFIIFILAILLISSIGGAYATLSYHPIQEEKLKYMNWWDKLFYNVQPFTTVNNANCDTFPSTFSKIPLRLGSTIGCPATTPLGGTNAGCAIVIWDPTNFECCKTSLWFDNFEWRVDCGGITITEAPLSNCASYPFPDEVAYQNLVEQDRPMNPGETYSPPYDYYIYENYQCPKTSTPCTSGSVYDAGCGYESCPSDMMGRAKTTNPPHCDNWFHTGYDISYTCVSRAECEPEICTNQCLPGQQQCLTSNTQRTCGNYDDDDCLEWSGPNYCSLGSECNFNTGQCEQTVCLDTTWSPLSSNYCSGQGFTQTSDCGRTRTATGTKYCPTPPPPPPPICAAENLQLTTSDDDFKVDIKTAPTSVVKDSNINIVATVTNRGESGAMVIECGVYPESYVRGEAGWLFALTGTPQVRTNCVSTEDFVQTKKIALCAGQSIDIPFTFKARKYADINYIFCQPYERCGVR